MENKKKTRKIANRIACGITITLIASVGATAGTTAVKRGNALSGVDKRYLTRTIFNVPVMLPVSNGTVKLNIDPMFTDEQKAQLVKGINELDNLIDGFDYTITFDEKADKKAINIRSFVENEKSKNEGIAVTTASINQWTAKIKYPITIRFDTDLIEEKKMNYDYIIKHELLHTLGLKDVTYVKDIGNLMYAYYEKYNQNLNGEQIKALDSLYGVNKDAVVQLELPTTVEYYNNNQVENFSVEEETIPC